MTCPTCSGLGFTPGLDPMEVCPSCNGWGADEVGEKAYEFCHEREWMPNVPLLETIFANPDWKLDLSMSADAVAGARIYPDAQARVRPRFGTTEDWAAELDRARNRNPKEDD